MKCKIYVKHYFNKLLKTIASEKYFSQEWADIVPSLELLLWISSFYLGESFENILKYWDELRNNLSFSVQTQQSEGLEEFLYNLTSFRNISCSPVCSQDLLTPLHDCWYSSLANLSFQYQSSAHLSGLGILSFWRFYL